MTALLIDAVIFILLILSVVFGGIGVIGLLILPDIRSRMYTATRAPVISTSAMIFAVIVYAFSMFLTNGGNLYVTLIFHTLVLLSIVIVANVLMYWTILERAKTVSTCQAAPDRTGEGK